MDFAAYLLRFRFRALDDLYFPAGKPGNILRGAFGSIFRKIACAPECPGPAGCAQRQTCPYARIFEPAQAGGSGPSGFADWPRPFVFRACHLDGKPIARGSEFYFDVNIFDLRDPAIAYFVLAFAQLVREGLGPGRGRAELHEVSTRGDGLIVFDGRALKGVDIRPVRWPLTPRSQAVGRIRVRFVTPTELKSEQKVTHRPEFPVLFGRVRDRVATLRALYGDGPLDIDFKAMGERAAAVRMTSSDLRMFEVDRLSSRTGQRHPLGGFIGAAEYEGEGLEEFVPWLEAAGVTGVGRQTTWGKGEIEVQGI